MVRPYGLIGPFAERLQRGRLEEVTQREFDAEDPADSRDDLRCQEGVSAQLEEVVPPADALDSQHMGEEARQQFLCGSTRRLVVGTFHAG